MLLQRWRFRRHGAVHHEVELAVLIGATLRERPKIHVRKRWPVMAWRLI